MPHDRVAILEDRLEAATFELTDLRRSVEAQNLIVADCRHDWRNFLDAVARAVSTEPTPIMSPPFSPTCSLTDKSA